MPRLKKGEKAPGIARRELAAVESTKRKIEYLLDAKKSVPESIRTSEDIAQWNNVEVGISKVSVKTFRKYVNAHFEGGMPELLKALEKRRGELQPKAKASQSVSKKDKSSEQHYAETVMEITARYQDLLDRVRRQALKNPTIAGELRRHLAVHAFKKPSLTLIK